MLLRTSEVLSDLEVRQGKRVLYRGDALITSVVSTSILLVVSATLSGPWLEFHEAPGDEQALRREAQDFVKSWNSANRFDDNYRLRVNDMKSFLDDLRHWLDQIDMAREKDGDGATPIGPIKGEAFDELFEPLRPRLTELILELEAAGRKLDPAEYDAHKELAQRELLPLWMPSPFFYRVYSKPLGYAGDYEMVNMMFRNEVSGRTTYAQVVDGWLLSGEPSEAHRNRIYMLERVLQEFAQSNASRNRPLRILNIGCGPAHELQMFLSNYKDDHRFKIDLLDFNEETLAYTKGKLGAMNGKVSDHAEISYTLKSVQDLLRQAIERNEAPEPYDLIYCAGLFDYLTERVCAKLVKLFYHWCEPGGRVLVTNVHSSNPYTCVLDQVMEWHLVQRNDEEMLRLAPEQAPVKVYKDRTGLNVFLDISKPS